jgi:CRP-like cAMP-binding protein
VNPVASQVRPIAGKGAIRTPAGAADEDLQVLYRIGSKLRFDRSETIFNEGDPAEYAYKVLSEAIRLCKHIADGRRQIAQFLLPGDFFSFMTLSEHSFSADVVSDTTLICYPRRQIERLGEERPSLRKRFSALLSRADRTSPIICASPSKRFAASFRP